MTQEKNQKREKVNTRRVGQKGGGQRYHRTANRMKAAKGKSAIRNNGAQKKGGRRKIPLKN